MNQIEIIEHDLYALDNLGRAYTRNKDAIIGLLYRCDMCTCQGIINRVGNELGIGTDAVVVLKTAECELIARKTWEVLKGIKPLTPEEIKFVQGMPM